MFSYLTGFLEGIAEVILMKDLILLFAALAEFVLGYFFMDGADRFMKKLRRKRDSDDL